MHPDFLYTILQCPITGEELIIANQDQLQMVNAGNDRIKFENGFCNRAGSWFYPFQKDIIFLHPHYAISLKNELHENKMQFDKKRIFNYFNSIEYIAFKGQDIYSDSKKFVDYRPFMIPYNEQGFSKARKHLPTSGKFYIDVACGPVAFKEYIQLADGFDYRICIDQSATALMHAKQNLDKKGQKGVFICGDITALPLKANIGDAVLCQHALFHVQKSLQKKALEELVRIAKPGKRVAIVYDQFYHSRLMNLALGPYQLYRIIRHWAGKLYARLFKKNKLYFYSYPLSWFYKNNPGKSISIYSWRSINIHFSKIYLHRSLGGEKLIQYIQRKEEEDPERMGRIGEYPIIVIEK